MPDGIHSVVPVYVSIGSNIAPAENLRMACRELHAHYGQMIFSPVYQSPAVGFEGDDFLNMVVGFRSSDTPRQIIEAMELLHRKARRVRQSNPFSPRTLDLDVLLYGDLVEPRLKLPHPDIEQYAFVLRPLAELVPAFRHPVSGKSMAELWDNFDQPTLQLTEVEIGRLPEAQPVFETCA